MFRSIIKSLCLILLSAAILSQSSSGGEKLRYLMAKGSTYKYKLNIKSDMKSQAMGQEMAATSASFIGVSMTVENVGDDGVLTLIAKVDTNLTRIESMMMNDSALVIKEVNGKRVRVTMSALGKTLKSEIVDSIKMTQVMQMARINPGDILRQVFVPLPEKDVAAGDTWKNTTPDTVKNQGMKLITKPDIQFKVVGSERHGGYDCLKISFEGPVSIYGTGSQMGMEMVIDGTSKTKGTAYFAPQQGLLVSTESSSTMDMNISGTGEQMFTATQSMNLTQKMVLGK